MAVGGEVVATECGERSAAFGPADSQARDQDADSGTRCVRVFEVVQDVGMTGLELPGRRIVAIALLRDGERDDARLGRSQPGDEGGRVLRCDQNVQDRADDPQLRPGGGKLQEGVEPVLRLESVALVGALEARADDAPGTKALLKRILGVFGEMAAGEGAEAEMDDAWLEGRAIIGRAANRGRQAREGGGAEAGHSL